MGTEAERGTDSWAALQQAEGSVGGLQQHVEAATPAAWAAQKALIDDQLPFGQRQDTGRLHELFMANPQVMAQPLINEHYLEYGSGPLQLKGRTHLNNEVSSALGFTPDSPLDPSLPDSHEQWRRHTDLYGGLSGSQKKARDAVADEIAGIGGDQAKVTLLPVVYSTPQSGVVKTTLFKVDDGHGGAKFVDERGARYKDLDDYRANNALPSTDCNIVMPASDKVELDSLGNVKVQVLDARTETGWETFKRRSHFDTIVGGASVVLGVVMTVGSGGMLAPVAAGLLVAASAYGATTSIMSLSNRSSHGLSINPFTDREARLDWLNLAGSVLAVPTLSAATRAGMVAWQATRAAKAAGAITTRMPWLAIRGSKETGKFLAGAARTEGPAGAQAAAMQDKMAFWNTPARVMAKPTMAVGGLGLEENTRYMADNWGSMTSDQRWEQGGMTLLNLVDFASPVLVKGVQAGRQGARGPAGSEPAAPVPPREPVPDLGSQTFGSLPDVLSTEAGMARLAALSPAASARIRQRLLNDIEQVVLRARNHEQGNDLSLHEAICASRTERAFGLQLRPSTTDGIDLHGPALHAGQRWQDVSLKGPFLTKNGLLPLPPQAQRNAIGRVEGHIRGNTAVDVHVVDLFGLSEQAAHDMQAALTAPALAHELAQRNQRVVFLPHDMPAGYESGVAQLLRTVSGRGAGQGPKFAGHAADDTTPSTQLERRDPQRRELVRYEPLSPRAVQPGTPARQALPEGVSVDHGRVHPGARQVNPTRAQDNCVPSAVTYDRMRHDPDAAMSAVPSQPQGIPHVIDLYGGLGAMEARGSAGLHGAPDTHEYLASLPEGTRGFLALMPRLTGTHEAPGHMINFEVRRGGRVEMIDAQAGRHVKGFEAPRVAVLVTHRPGTEPVNPSVVGGERLRRYLAAAARVHEGDQGGTAPELTGGVYGSSQPHPAASGQAGHVGQTATGSRTPVQAAGEVADDSIRIRPAYEGSEKPPTLSSRIRRNWTTLPNAAGLAQRDYLTSAPSPDGSAALDVPLWRRAIEWRKNWSGGFLGRRDEVGVIYLSDITLSPHDVVKDGRVDLSNGAQVHGSFAEARAHTMALLKAAREQQGGNPPTASAWVFRHVGREEVLVQGLRDGSLLVDTVDGAVRMSETGDLHRTSWVNRNAADAPKPGDEFYKPPQAPGRLKRASILAGSFVANGVSAGAVFYVSYRYGHGSSLKPTVEWLGHAALAATAYRATAASGRWIAATRLDQRVDNLQGLLQAAGSGAPEQRRAALQTLQKQLTGLRGAARGIAHHDRLNYHLAIEGLRRNPTDPQFNAVLLTAKDKVLSPTSVLGRTHLAVRIASFAFSNASAAKFAHNPTAGWADYGTGAVSTAGNTAWATQNTADNAAASMGYVLKKPSPGAKEKLYPAHPLPEQMGKDGRLRAFARTLTLRHLTAHDGTLPNLKEPGQANLPMVKPPWSMRLKQYAARVDQLGMMATVGAVDALHAWAAATTGHPAAAAAEVGKVLFGGVLVRAFQKDRIDEVRTNHQMAPVVYEARSPFKWLNAPSRGAVEYSDSTVATTRLRQAGFSAMVLLGAGAAGRVMLGVLAPWEEENGKQQPAPPGPGAGSSATPSASPSATPGTTPGTTPSTPASTPSPSVSQAPSSSAPLPRRRYPPNLLP